MQIGQISGEILPNLHHKKNKKYIQDIGRCPRFLRVIEFLYLFLKWACHAKMKTTYFLILKVFVFISVAKANTALLPAKENFVANSAQNNLDYKQVEKITSKKKYDLQVGSSWNQQCLRRQNLCNDSLFFSMKWDWYFSSLYTLYYEFALAQEYSPNVMWYLDTSLLGIRTKPYDFEFMQNYFLSEIQMATKPSNTNIESEYFTAHLQWYSTWPILQKWNSKNESLAFVFSPMIKKSFHQYKTSSLGESNINYAFLYALGLAYQLNKYKLEIIYQQKQSMDYTYSKFNDYLFYQKLSWQKSHKSIFVMHSQSSNSLLSDLKQNSNEFNNFFSTQITLGGTYVF